MNFRFDRFSLIMCLVFLFSPLVSARAAHVDVIEINDSINPAIFEFISEAINRAENNGAECIIIKLDTPGGLLTSTREIVKDILNSKVPVIVYIAPKGAWAASAGTFITLASHVAVMSPSTNIGAAHPVSIGSPGGGSKKGLEDIFEEMAKKSEESNPADEKPQPSEAADDSNEKGEEEEVSPKALSEQDVMSEKIVQHTTSWIRAIAQLRNRNADWAEKAVTESLSISETEALEKNVIDLIAEDIDDLLTKINGRTVNINGKDLVLQTDKVQVKTYEMTLRQKILSTISNPNLFFILVLLGPLGLVIELYNPGLILPGIVGGISIILLLYASQVLPVNYAALLLILLALVLFIAEVKIQSFGLLTLSGVVCIVLGGLMLFRTGSDLPTDEFRVAYSTIATVVVVLLLFVFVVLERVFRVHSTKETTGAQGMIGKRGMAKTDISPQGVVFVHGERWNAVSDTPISAGAQVEVLAIDGLTLKVKALIMS